MECEFSKADVERYSRQLLMPDIGVTGQKRLLQGQVLVIGAGGLASSCLLYLAGAGVGHIGVVDHDHIERSNLHRQILHTDQGADDRKNKAESAREAVLRLNPAIRCTAYPVLFSRENALEIIRQKTKDATEHANSVYDVVVDCTDNPHTRYLVNDACVLSHVPLVSASAIQMEGQLAIYNYADGPCYRCLHPKPPAPNRTANCSNSGVMGAVPGLLGCLQAIEVVKILTGSANVFRDQMLLVDAFDLQFRHFRTAKNPSCAICGENATIKELEDYTAFCGASPTDKVKVGVDYISPDRCLSPQEFHSLITASSPNEQQDQATSNGKPDFLLIDVRSALQFAICSLKNAVNIPIGQLPGKIEFLKENYAEQIANGKAFVICRRGNDSQKAALLLEGQGIPVKHITGGLTAWEQLVDPEFPMY